MNKLKIYGALSGSAAFAGGIAWLLSAPWWVIVISMIGAPMVLVVLFCIAVFNELSKWI